MRDTLGRTYLTAAIALAMAHPLHAQDEASPIDTFGHSRHGAEFDEGPRQAAYLMRGLSPQVHFAVRGLSEEAQRYFDQGICQQHGFWYFEAERSFRQVALLHPDCALAYLGMCLANVENHTRGSGFAAQAVQRSADLQARELAWVDAFADYHQITAAERTELQCGDAARIETARQAIIERAKSHDDQKTGRDLVRALERIVNEWPEDLEAKAFLIVQIWRNSRSGLEITSHGAVDALLDQLLAVAPLHPAHHFRVHLWDDEKPERAVRSAATLGRTAPGIAHQWHMGGHIFDRLGRFADAAWQQEASGRIDHAFMHRDRVMPYESHNYGHNQEWLSRSLSAIGRVHDATALAANMVSLPRHPKRNRVEASEDIAGYGRVRLLETLEAFECWPELIAACTGGLVEATADVGEQVRRLQALGTAQYRSNDLAAGDAVLAEAEALRDRLRRDRATAIDAAEDAAEARKASREDRSTDLVTALKKHDDTLQRAFDLLQRLRGEAALARNDGKLALEHFERASGTPPWPRAQAEMLLGEHDKAVERLTTALGEKPKTQTLARLCIALHRAGKTEELCTRFLELQKIAGHADLDAPLLQRLGEVAAAMNLPTDWRLPQPPAADVADRPALDALGPFRWQPQAAPEFDLERTDGTRVTLADRRGRPTLLVFYLGFGCAHCVEQLRAFGPKVEAFTQRGIDMFAIGNQDAATVRELQDGLPEDQRISLRLCADPDHVAFRAFRAFDDFEGMALHATVLIDGDGRVRWQDVSAEPFVDVDWLLAECERLLLLPAHAGSR